MEAKKVKKTVSWSLTGSELQIHILMTDVFLESNIDFPLEDLPFTKGGVTPKLGQLWLATEDWEASIITVISLQSQFFAKVSAFIRFFLGLLFGRSLCY